MVIRAVENLKGRILFEKEHSKTDIHYIKKLQESLKDDLLYIAGIFYNERNLLKMKIDIAEEVHIDDKFLLTKCREVIEDSDKLSKKLSKYRDIKSIKCIKFRDMYNAYMLISEANQTVSIIKHYLVQLNRYTNIE